jgi:hypothetical protein
MYTNHTYTIKVVKKGLQPKPEAFCNCGAFRRDAG